MEIGNDCWLRVGLAFNYISRVLLTSVIAPCNQCLSPPTTVGGAKNAHPCEGRSPVMTNDWRRKGSVLLHCETGSQDLSLDRHTSATSCHTLLYLCRYEDHRPFLQKKWHPNLLECHHRIFVPWIPFPHPFRIVGTYWRLTLGHALPPEIVKIKTRKTSCLPICPVSLQARAAMVEL